MRQVLILILVGLAIGFGAGEVFFAADPQTLDEPIATEEARHVVAPQEDVTLEIAARDPSPALETQLQAHIDAMPLPTFGEVAGSIHGVAVDDTGKPVVGLELRLRPTGVAPDHHATVVETNPFDEYIERRVAEHRYRNQLQRRATTDSDGVFRFDDLLFNNYRIVPARPELESALRIEVDGRSRNWARPGQEIFVRVTAGRSVTVAVLDVSGELLKEASLYDRSGTHYPWNKDQPLVQFRVESSFVHAQFSDGRRSPEVELPVAGSSLTLQLEEPVTLKVVPELPPLLKHAYVDVFVLRAVGKPFDPVELRSMGRMMSGAGGEERLFAGLVPGSYWVGAAMFPGTVDVVEQIDVQAGTQIVTLHVPPATLDKSVRVRAFDEHGERLDVYWQLYRGLDTNSRAIDVDSVLLEDGWSVLVADVDFDDYFADRIPLRLYLSAMSSKHDWEQRIAELTSRAVTVHFGEKVDATFELLSERGGDVAKVALFRPRSLVPASYDGATGLHQASVAPGDYSLDVYVAGLKVFSEAVTIDARNKHRSIQIPPLYRVELRGLPLACQVYSGRGDHIANCVEEKPLVLLLPPGRYVAVDEGVMAFEVSRDAVIEFAPRPLVGLTVVLLEQTSAYGLNDGDVVVEVDGVALNGVTKGRAQLRRALSNSGTTELTVYRNGRAVNVSVEPRMAGMLRYQIDVETIRLVPESR